MLTPTRSMTLGVALLRGEVDCNTGRAVIDALKWAASHRAPRRYGNKVVNELTGRDGAAIEIVGEQTQIDTARRIAMALGTALQRLEASKRIEGEQNDG
jgi:lysine/ornithine N-monooxygenase